MSAFRVNIGKTHQLLTTAETNYKTTERLREQLASVDTDGMCANLAMGDDLQVYLMPYYAKGAPQTYPDSYMHRLEGLAQGFKSMSVRLRNINQLCYECERSLIEQLDDMVAGNVAFAASMDKHVESYAVTLAAEKAAADQAAKDAADKAAAAKAKQEADEAAKEEARKQREAKLAIIAPGAWAILQDRMTEAEFLDLLEDYKDDPEMYAAIQKEYEAWKKAKEEAAKLAERGEGAEGELGGDLGLGLEDSGFDVGGGGLGGSDWGGSDLGGDLGLGGSDFGGSDLGGDWGASDFASDLLDESLDTGEFDAAGSALDEIAGSAAGEAVARGVDALTGDAVGEEAAGVLGQYGEKAWDVVRAYGLQTSLALGGAAALYLTREQTTEAVAHVAEFVSTKCRPAVNDVLDQVRGAAKQTRINVGNVRSNAVAVVRGEKAGDLLG